MKKILIFGNLFCFVSLAIAHGGGQDSQGGHFDTSDNTYHCHAPSGCVDLDDVYFTVTDVKDGDTIDVTHLEYTVTVRLLGVDTPETNHPFEPVGFYGPEAKEYTRQRLYGKKVKLSFDHQQKDAFDRLLVYVYLGGVLFNLELVREGYGVADVEHEYEKRNEFVSAQEEAKAQNKGVWSDPNRIDLPIFIATQDSLFRARHGDLDFDGTISISDFLLFVAEFGKTLIDGVYQ